tara:strand:- start:9098 stop:9937 length:840 start_codon:yes stop_codon:yes gene_type:complete
LSNKVLVLYHANCPDGFGAAWAFWKKYGDSARYIPVSHGKEPPDVTGYKVYMVDFCYKREVLLNLNKSAKSITVIDHHKSSMEECGDIHFCNFDMNHSGAYLAWKYLFGEDNVPLLIRYVQDRDLWKWELDSSEEILSAVDSFDRNFFSWDSINEGLDKIGSEGWRSYLFMGQAILRYKNNLIHSMLRNCHTINIMGKEIPSINIPFFQSEMASKLSEGSDYAAAYYFDGTGYKFSLRSKESGADVSVVASVFGGGGHKNASGFRVDSLSDLNSEVTDG